MKTEQHYSHIIVPSGTMKYPPILMDRYLLDKFTFLGNLLLIFISVLFVFQKRCVEVGIRMKAKQMNAHENLQLIQRTSDLATKLGYKTAGYQELFDHI